MLVSMTGFGSSSYEDSSLSINIELKSFNSRYFELNTKSFDLSGPLEYKIRNYLKKQLLRGSVTLFIKVDSKDTFRFNSQKTSSVLKAYKEIEKKYDINLNYSQLLRNNDILSYVPHSNSIQKKIFSSLKIATKELINMRNKEGAIIEKEFYGYLDIAKKDLLKIEKIQEKVHASKINLKSNNDVIDEIEKIDISEEIDRINSHLSQISQSIKSKQLSGKKINFILQEINRESNTILSKFLDKRVSKHAISLKMQAEKLREQIGNILWKILSLFPDHQAQGKTTLLELLSRDLNIEISVSYTTRNKRKYEIDGVHYNFINKEQFEKMIEEDLFLEHENVHGDLYGTALSSLEQYIDNNKHLFFELDVNGAVSLMNYYPSNTISIFLSPPNMEELRKRLVLRSTETEEEINKRLSRFEEEDNLKKEFDYNLINDNFETTFEKIKEIINRHKKED